MVNRIIKGVEVLLLEIHSKIECCTEKNFEHISVSKQLCQSRKFLT